MDAEFQPRRAAFGSLGNIVSRPPRRWQLLHNSGDFADRNADTERCLGRFFYDPFGGLVSDAGNEIVKDVAVFRNPLSQTLARLAGADDVSVVLTNPGRSVVTGEFVSMALLKQERIVASARTTNQNRRDHNPLPPASIKNNNGGADERNKSMNKASTGGWWLHVVVLAIVIVAEVIGIRRLPIGIGTVVFLPILYAFALGIALNPHIFKKTAALLSPTAAKLSGTMITIAIMPFIAKFGTTVGPKIDAIIKAGPALVIQELGNLGTILVAFPVAVFLLRMGRESIGATYSIDREPNLAVIADRYGLNSPEGAGAMGVYATGTLIGTFVFAIMPPLIHALGWFDYRALAMSCGVGSGSMLAACTGGLVAVMPENKDLVLALAAASNILTYATGLYVGLFVALPLTEWLYRKARSGDPANATLKETRA